MLTVLLGLSGALVYGAADFIGGLAARRISAIRVTAIGGASGLVLLVALLPVVGGRWSSEAIVLGALSGVSGAAAIALLYACLAIGPMSILSPLTAVISAIVPLLAGLIRGERFEPIGYVALALALVAVVLVGFVPDEKAVRPSRRALTMAVASGALIGVFLIVIDLTPDDSGVVPLLGNRAVNALILFTVIGALTLRGRMTRTVKLRQSRRRTVGLGQSRRRLRDPGAAGTSDRTVLRDPSAAGASDRGSPQNRGWRPGLLLAIVGGAVDAAANVLLLLGLRVGDLSVVSVLTAMYPAGTIILAAIVLRERIAPTQYVGLALAIAAAAMLSLA